jgi:endonuclease-8
MPEGDTIFRAARTLAAALASHEVIRFESVFPQLNRIDQDDPIAGRRIEGVRSRGKHLLIDFSNDLTLRTHLRMNGIWHLYSVNERWRQPRDEARIVLSTESHSAVAFSIQVAQFFQTSAETRTDALRRLGPDLLSPDYDPLEAFRRLRAAGGRPVAEALLDQKIIAGIGNVFKSEILFVVGIDPATPVESLEDRELTRILEKGRLLLNLNVNRSTRPQQGRWTTGRLNPAERLWVYGRRGKPCFRCGTEIAYWKGGDDARSTYWCPRCQPARATSLR